MKISSSLVVWLTQLAAAVGVLFLVFEVFTRNRVYGAMLSEMDFVFPDLRVYQVLILGLFFIGLLILMMFGSERLSLGAWDFLWVLVLPSVLWFSRVDWFRILGLPFNFGELAPNVPFAVVVAAGLLLVCSRVFFSFVFQVRGTRQELLGRGASGLDVEGALDEQSRFFLRFVFACAGVASLIVVAAWTGEAALERSLPEVQFPYVVLGLASATLLTVCTAFYLRDHAEVGSASSVKPSARATPTGVGAPKAVAEVVTADRAATTSEDSCVHFGSDEKCGAMKRSRLWDFDLWAQARALRVERCRNEFKDSCCYLCDLRLSCSISCSFPDPRRSRDDVESLERRPFPINASFLRQIHEQSHSLFRSQCGNCIHFLRPECPRSLDCDDVLSRTMYPCQKFVHIRFDASKKDKP